MDLTKDNITTLIKKMAVPASIGTFFQTMYNLVDSKFAGLISPEALTAIVKSFPIYLIIIAASVGISAGTTALISNTLGKKDNEKASVLFAQSILVALLITLILRLDSFLLIDLDTSIPSRVLINASPRLLDTSPIH